jgi:hypothetical protein
MPEVVEWQLERGGGLHVYRNASRLETMRSRYASDAIWEIPVLGLRYDGVAALVEMWRGPPVLIRGVTHIDSAAIDVYKGDETNQEFYGVYYDRLYEGLAVQLCREGLAPRSAGLVGHPQTHSVVAFGVREKRSIGVGLVAARPTD